MTAHAHNRIANGRPAQPSAESPSTNAGSIHQQALELFAKSPLSVTLGVFGVGLAAGAMLGGLMVASRERQAHSLGQKALESLSQLLPDALEQKLGRTS